MSQRARIARERQQRRRRGSGVVFVVLGVSLLGVVLMGGLFGADRASDPAAGATRVSMTEFEFDPAPIVLSSGADGRLEVVNDGRIAHDLVVIELGKGTPDLRPGQSVVLDLSDQPPGTYRVVCDITGHTEAGMVTELTLT